MSGYRYNSEWNDENELRCLVIFKRLEEKEFPRGMQMKLCREMSPVTNLDVGNISAKVCNYKSVAGVNNESNASTKTIEIYRRYRKLSIPEIQKIIEKTSALQQVNAVERGSGINYFQKLCLHAANNNWCWNLWCTTCGHQSFRRAFEVMARGIDPTSELGQRIIHRSTISSPGNRPEPKLIYSEDEKAAVVRSCMDADLKTISLNSKFPEWLGYLGLILFHMQSDSEDFQRLTNNWARQLTALVEPGSRAEQALRECLEQSNRMLGLPDLELCEYGMRVEFGRYRNT
jgi:hypothetical protein